jgi:hypothetical protein
MTRLSPPPPTFRYRVLWDYHISKQRRATWYEKPPRRLDRQFVELRRLYQSPMTIGAIGRAALPRMVAARQHGQDECPRQIRGRKTRESAGLLWRCQLTSAPGTAIVSSTLERPGSSPPQMPSAEKARAHKRKFLISSCPGRLTPLSATFGYSVNFQGCATRRFMFMDVFCVESPGRFRAGWLLCR